MLRELRIKNFKCWEDTGPIRMAPITLFFGANSSGKSSIGQFLMMLKQTVESPDRKAVFYPGGKSSAVQLGGYQEMVYLRDPLKKIEFEYKWDIPDKELVIKDSINNKSFSGSNLAFNASISLDEDQHSVVLNDLRYRLFDLNNDEVFSIGMERRNGGKSEYKIESTGYHLKRKQGRWQPGPPVRFYGFPDEVVAYHQNADFVQELNLIHEKFFRSVFYLGPLRTKAERLYSWTGIEPESVGYSGENTIAAILASLKRKINPAYKRRAKGFQQIIAEKLKDMRLIDEFKIKSISEKRQEYEVKVKTSGADFVDLPDVGFGVSQVLPVLVQIFYAPHNSIIIMEQPEIHLHPAAQATLADVMIDAIDCREQGKDRNIQLIIETHSEHFLRRLQRRIAENRISEDKVSACFADITKIPARLEPLQIDMFGNILNWPQNFFGDEITDIAEQSKAAIDRKITMSAGQN